jgi:hypothetical protein
VRRPRFPISPSSFCRYCCHLRAAAGELAAADEVELADEVEGVVADEVAMELADEVEGAVADEAAIELEGEVGVEAPGSGAAAVDKPPCAAGAGLRYLVEDLEAPFSTLPFWVAAILGAPFCSQVVPRPLPRLELSPVVGPRPLPRFELSPVVGPRPLPRFELSPVVGLWLFLLRAFVVPVFAVLKRSYFPASE